MNQKSQQKINLDIEPEHTGERIDVYLASLLANFSRTRIQNLIDSNNVVVNDKPVKRSYKLRYGDNINIELPEEKPINIEPENIPLEFVYQDKDLAVVNKPAGMLTHPAPGQYSGTLVNALLYHCKETLSGINGYLRPGIIHRLDRDTSGLILIAKNDMAHINLARQIQERTVDKYYITIVQGNIREDSGVINEPIGRHPVKRDKMTVIESGKEAITEWRVLERFKEATLVEVKIITGRTHQIRVHFAHMKHPVLGDNVYGNTKNQKIKLDSQALQACKISFTHPASGERLTFEILFDKDIQKVLKIYNKPKFHCISDF